VSAEAQLRALVGLAVEDATLSAGDERLTLVFADGSTLSVEVDHAPQPGYSAVLHVRHTRDYSRRTPQTGG